eukprot:GHRQ01014158.1.p3 GENE.GHRQ01014158.1~~GHRQ01014158.1.p3  ORF type:complete len:113 (+),score=14.62 GHRQ01014158.1:408-746(+)
MHYFALPWLQTAVQQLEQAAAYHIAHKQIPERGGGTVPGVKLEMFIFDPFHSAKDVTLFEVCKQCSNHHSYALSIKRKDVGCDHDMRWLLRHVSGIAVPHAALNLGGAWQLC